MTERANAIDQLQRISAELSELHGGLNGSDVDREILSMFREAITQIRGTVSALLQTIDAPQLASAKKSALALLHEERMLRACELNGTIIAALESGQIKTDQEGLSVYLEILNRTMDRFDLTFESRKTER